MIRAAIFDLDGTLVDSNELHVLAWQETFRHSARRSRSSGSGNKSARAAILCGGFSEQVLRDEGAVAIFRDPADLLERYYQSPLAG